MFGKEWFKKHQAKLLWLLNTPAIRRWFRYCMRIRSFDLPLKEKITEITPNSFSWGNKLILKEGKLYEQKKTDFRTHSKFSKRVFYAFKPLWALFHAWDILIANNLNPAWNLGFDTTFYPAAGTGGTDPVDGWVSKQGYGLTWSQLRDGSGNVHDDTTDRTVACAIYSMGEGWGNLYRGIFLFDTSSIDRSIIVSATFSIYGFQEPGTDSHLSDPKINVYSSDPASVTELASGDYNSLGITAYCDTDIDSSGWNDSGYNDFIFNSTGKSAVSKTGITKLGTREVTYDVADNDGGAGGHDERSGYQCSFADREGTSEDPKLVLEIQEVIWIDASETIEMTDSLEISLSALLSIAKLSGYTTDSDRKSIAFNVSGPGYKSQIDIIEVQTEELESGARVDFTLYYDKEKSNVSLGSISYSASSNKTKHTLMRKGPHVEDFRIDLDYSNGSTSKTVKIRSIKIKGHYIKD